MAASPHAISSLASIENDVCAVPIVQPPQAKQPAAPVDPPSRGDITTNFLLGVQPPLEYLQVIGWRAEEHVDLAFVSLVLMCGGGRGRGVVGMGCGGRSL